MSWRLGMVALLVPFISACELSKMAEPPAEIIAEFDLSDFYRKYHSVGGLPILSSKRVSDTALLEAAYLIDKIIGHRPDILEAIIDADVRFVVMSEDEFISDIPEYETLTPQKYWDRRARGLGATDERPVVSCGEENLLGYDGDPYEAENILIHEFAHVIHQKGLNRIDPTFQKRLEKAFNRATLKGLWKSKYAGTNPAEYWAEGVQSWFDTNTENGPEHNHVDTREELIEHDPGLAELVEGVFGNRGWRYQLPDERLETSPHLAGFNPDRLPAFRWPRELDEAYAATISGEGLVAIPEIPIHKAERSPSGRKEVQVTFKNRTDKRVTVKWVGESGQRMSYESIDPGRSYSQISYAGHFWVVTDPTGAAVTAMETPEKDGFFVIE